MSCFCTTEELCCSSVESNQGMAAPTCLVTFVDYHTKATSDDEDDEEISDQDTRSLTEDERREKKILISEKEVKKYMEKYNDDKMTGGALLCAALLWQEMELKYLGEDKISTIRKIVDEIGEGSLGLIGPDNGTITRLFEHFLGRNPIFRCHALSHDVAGRFLLKHNLGPGYLYTMAPKEGEWGIKKWWRGSPGAGQITGLCNALWNRNNFMKMISIEM